MSIRTRIKNPTWRVDLEVHTFPWTLERWGDRWSRHGWYDYHCPNMLPENGLHITLAWAPTTGSILLFKPAQSLGEHGVPSTHLRACEVASRIDVQAMMWGPQGAGLPTLWDLYTKLKSDKEEESK